MYVCVYVCMAWNDAYLHTVYLLAGADPNSFATSIYIVNSGVGPTYN